MTAIADIAGKGNMRKAKKVTSEYAYKGGTRRHKVTSQGRWMLKMLKDRYSNDFVYPAVEDSLPDAEQKVKLVIEKYARMVNRKLN
jgi:predicted ATP-grasp superfamily ATP-dependent carboligase